ncbi:MAG: hypothetical protein QOJ07_2997 [Thermoleophilaceae bacterium]|nr:hypothetical protein [Thermoleophilaceae bacterium]
MPPAFRFVQLEFGWALGPSDGRYLRRAGPDADAELVVVLATLGAPQRRLLRGRKATEVSEGEPEPVPTSRATLIAPQPFESTAAARAWLESVRGDEDALGEAVRSAVRELNAVLRAHRAAAQDPYARDVRHEGALIVRVGYGAGDQVADGRYAEAVELPRGGRRRREPRRARLEPQERLAAVLGGRDALLAGEELLLRARADVDQDRPREAALQARVALEALIAELGAAGQDVGALGDHRKAVGAAANAALAGDPPDDLQDAVLAAVAAMERELRIRHTGD